MQEEGGLLIMRTVLPIYSFMLSVPSCLCCRLNLVRLCHLRTYKAERVLAKVPFYPSESIALTLCTI
jgi:hypothetical protein